MESGRSVEVYSLEDVKLELAGWLLADMLRLAGLFGSEAPFLMVGLIPPRMPGRVALTLARQSHDLSLYDIDIERLPVGRLVMALYDYAYHQRFPVGMAPHALEAEMEMVEDLVFYLRSETLSLFQGDNFHMREANKHDWQAVPTVYKIAKARLNLDSGEALTLDEIALLADMAEKSVRNALLATAEGHLVAHKDRVENGEARRWLLLRRSFRPTRFSDVGSHPGAHPPTLNSVLDIENFVSSRWRALNKGSAEVIQELGWSSARQDYLEGIISNAQTIDPRDCGALAKSLLVDESWFTTQVLTNLYPDQIALLLSRQQDPVPAALEHPVDEQRVCLRVCFVLKDGAVLHPIRMKNRATGRISFRLSKGGTGGNTLENTIEIDDELEMIDHVCKHGLAVRAASLDGATHGLYRRGGRAVAEVRLDGVVITGDQS